MAVNVDSPKRRSLRLRDAENEVAAPGTGTRASVTAAPRNSGPVTRLSAGKKSLEEEEEEGALDRSQSRAKGKKDSRNRTGGNTSQDRSVGEHVPPSIGKSSKRGAAKHGTQTEETSDTPIGCNKGAHSGKSSEGSVEANKSVRRGARRNRESDPKHGASVEGYEEPSPRGDRRHAKQSAESAERPRDTYGISLRSRKSCEGQESNERETPTTTSNTASSAPKKVGTSVEAGHGECRLTTGIDKSSIKCSKEAAPTTAVLEGSGGNSVSPDKSKRTRRSQETLRLDELKSSRGSSEGIVSGDITCHRQDGSSVEIANSSPKGKRGAAHATIVGEEHGDPDSPGKNKTRRSHESLQVNEVKSSSRAYEGIVSGNVTDHTADDLSVGIANRSPKGKRGAAHDPFIGEGHGEDGSPDENRRLREGCKGQGASGLKILNGASECALSVGEETKQVEPKPSPRGKRKMARDTTREEGPEDLGGRTGSPNNKVSPRKSHEGSSSKTEKIHMESRVGANGEDGPASVKDNEKAGPSRETTERCQEESGAMTTKERDGEEAEHFVEPNTQCNQISKEGSPRNNSRPIKPEVSGDDGRQSHTEPHPAPSVSREVASNWVTRPEDLEEAGPSSSYCNVLTISHKAGPSGPSDGDNRWGYAPAGSTHRRDEKHPGPSLPGTSTALDGASSRDYKVHCCSKQLLQEVLNMCTGICEDLLNSQRYLNEEQKQQHHKSFAWDFETAFQENVSINGLPWQDAPEIDTEPDLKILEDQLDDVMVETARKRKRYPRKILSHYVKRLKTEREILSRYKPEVNPEKVSLDSAVEQRMKELSAATATICQHIHETKKALPAQLKKAEGFSQVLALQPVLEGSQLRKDIFSCRVVMEDILKSTPTVLETPPAESERQPQPTPVRSLRRRKASSAERQLYPLRSKRKITLET